MQGEIRGTVRDAAHNRTCDKRKNKRSKKNIKISLVRQAGFALCPDLFLARLKREE